MTPPCSRCQRPAAYVVTLKEEPTRRRDLCPSCAADAMVRRYTLSIVDGLAVWSSG